MDQIDLMVIAGYLLVFVVLGAWLLFVIRQRQWSIGSRIVVGAIGTVTFLFVVGYVATMLLRLEVAPGPTWTDPRQTPPPIRRVEPTPTPEA